MKITPVYSPKKKNSLWHPTCHSSFFFFLYKYLWLSTSGILHYSFNTKLIIWMQRARHDFISGKQDVSDSTWRWQISALAQRRGVHLFVNFVNFLSCLGRCNKRPSHNILLNRSIVHAIRLHVSEVPCSGSVSAHATCVPHPSPTEPHSGPPLTTKPGPAKRTVPECGTERSH